MKPEQARSDDCGGDDEKNPIHYLDVTLSLVKSRSKKRERSLSRVIGGLSTARQRIDALSCDNGLTVRGATRYKSVKLLGVGIAARIVVAVQIAWANRRN